MRDLSALTPPLLTCAVVLFAIVAFLRHELAKKSGQGERPADAGDPATGKEQAEPGPSSSRQDPATGNEQAGPGLSRPRRHPAPPESGRVAGATPRSGTSVSGGAHEPGEL